MSTRAPAAPQRRRTKVAVDPRMRERRVAVQRDVGRRRLRRLLLALAALVIVTAAVAAVLSPLLAFDEVAVVGAGERSAEVRAVVADDVGSALLLLDTGDLADQVERLPWVADARVERELPNTLRITVTPRVAVAWARNVDGTVALVDARAVVLAVAPAPPAGMAELTGATEVRALGARVDPPDGARVAAALGPLEGRVSAIVVGGGQATLRIVDGPEVRLGALDRLEEKARAADAVLAATALGALTYVDVRVPSAPVTG